MAIVAIIVSICTLHPLLLVGHAQQSRAANPAGDDPGHNAHQEAVIYGCLVAIAVLAVLCVLILWFLVGRTKSQIRVLDHIIPKIAERLRNECLEEANGEIVSGTLTASHEFDGPVSALSDDVVLTSYRRRNEAGTSTDFGSTASTNQTAVSNVDGDMNGYAEVRKKDYKRYVPESKRRDRLEAIIRASNENASRSPPPPYFYDNHAVTLRDENSTRRAHKQRRDKGVPRSTRPLSDVVITAHDNIYQDFSPRPISMVETRQAGDGQDRTHGRRNRSLLYESHV